MNLFHHRGASCYTELNIVVGVGFSPKIVSPWLMITTANFCRDKSATYIKNLIQGFCQIAGGNQGASFPI
ncbi:hypothetical protein [Pseudoalteromonas sp. GB43]